MKIALLVGFAFLLMSPSDPAPPPAALKQPVVIQVFDERGQSLPGATVELVHGFSTDVEGRCILPLTAPSTYTLRVTFPGYRPWSKTYLTGVMPESLEVRLEPGYEVIPATPEQDGSDLPEPGRYYRATPLRVGNVR